MMLGLIALVFAGCSGGGDEEPTSEPIPTARPGSTAAPLATAKPAGDAGDAD